MKRENLVYSQYFDYLIHATLNPVAGFYEALLVVSLEYARRDLYHVIHTE